MTPRISDMTLQELRELIRQEIANFHAAALPRFDPEEAAEFHEWLKQNRLTRTPDMPSLEEMLREDRDR